MSSLFSVILCTHNPRPAYLQRVLDGLARQTLDGAQWEFLVIDNASKTPLEGSVDLSFLQRSRMIREETLGLTAARLRAIRESTSKVLVFIDDDNVLAPDYLTHAATIEREWPVLGTWGGQILPEFEETPPAWIRPYLPALAIREVAHDRWSNIPEEANALPYGAGMCVRRAVAAAYAEALANDPRRVALDRRGASLISGGDTDLAFTACDLGFGNGVFARLQLAHLIPKERLEESYLLRLIEALSYSQAVLDSFRGRVLMRPSRSQRLFNFYRNLRIPRRERQFLAAQERGREAALAAIEQSGENRVAA